MKKEFSLRNTGTWYQVWIYMQRASAPAAALCCYTAVVAGAAAVLLLAATVRHGVSFRSVPQKGPSTMFLRTVL